MSVVDTADLWWKSAMVYCIDVETFADSNGDGVGDFPGLTERLDYLSGVGVTCLWLMPFYPTAGHDDGYDVIDYYAIDPRLGTLGDFTDFMRTARSRGLRVIADLVVNHTSNRHPWFVDARRSRDSAYRGFYVWRDEIPDDGPTGVVFPGTQQGVWSFDEAAGQFYLHRFYRQQPDLNIASAEVRAEIRKVMGFWLAQGLSGFRVDAVPFLLETAGIAEQVDVEPHDYLRDLRAFVQRRNGDAVLLGEVNLPFDEQRRFFGDEDGDELHMLFDFIGNQALFLGMARADAAPIITALRNRPALPEEAAWASFLRNHDELSLDKLSDAQRQEVFRAFGPQPDMQLYGRGLRRRVPPMLGGDTRRIRMAYSLLFAMPGTPTLFYGEEIGMGENLAMHDRLAVRTPMQWTEGPTGGFSTAPADRLTRQVPTGPYAPQNVNVQAQRADPQSLLRWFEELIALRKELHEVGWGSSTIIELDEPSVLAMRYQWHRRELITVHNLADRRVDVRLRFADAVDVRDLLGRHDPIEIDDGHATLALEPYDHRWLRVGG